MDYALLRVLVKNLKNAANDCNTRKHPTQWQGSQHRLKICEQCPYASCFFSIFSSSPALFDEFTMPFSTQLKLILLGEVSHRG